MLVRGIKYTRVHATSRIPNGSTYRSGQPKCLNTATISGGFTNLPRGAEQQQYHQQRADDAAGPDLFFEVAMGGV